MDSLGEMQSWPRLDIEYLEIEQIEHEAFIRNLPITRNIYGQFNPSSLKTVRNDILADPYEPWTVGHLRVDSPEEQDRQLKEFKRCKAGVLALESNAVPLDTTTVLHRAIHFVFRLDRLLLLKVDVMERKLNVKKKAKDMIRKCLRKLNPPQPIGVTRNNDTLIDLEDEDPNDKTNQVPNEPMISDPELSSEDKQTEQHEIDPSKPTGTIPKQVSSEEPQGLERVMISLFNKFEQRTEQARIADRQRLNDRLNAIEAKQAESRSNGQHMRSNERNDYRLIPPPMSIPRTPSSGPTRPSVPSERGMGYPLVPPVHNHDICEPRFLPNVNSTYRNGVNSSRERTRREDDNATYKKLDVLSRWRLCFNGTDVDEKHLALNDYIVSIERFINLQKLNPDDVLPYLLPTLSGNARIWYQAEGEAITTLEEFFTGLRYTFDYKQNSTDVIAAVLKINFDPSKGRLITHINKMECEMANCNIPPKTQLEVVLKTLPDNLRMMAATRDVGNLRDLRRWALKVFPPTLDDVNTKRKEFRRFSDKGKSVSAVTMSDNEEPEIDESDSESEMAHQICEMMKRFKTKVNLKPRNIQSVPWKRKDDSNPKQRSYSGDSTHDGNQIEGNDDTICFQCKKFGHAFHKCTAPRLFSFCYECGRPGVTNKNKCPSLSCIAKRNGEQKNE